MLYKINIIRVFIVITGIIFSYFSLQAQYKSQIDSSKSIIIQQDKRTDLQKLKGEEIKINQNENKVLLPGAKESIIYSPEQDSMYYSAMRTKITQSTRFNLELLEASKESAFLESIANTEWSVAMKNLAMIPQSSYKPLAVDVANYEYGIKQAFYVPGVRTLPGPGTMQISLSTIGRLLGLTEDVSPVFKYNVDAATDVEVVVYSIQAIVLQTMFKGYQQPGNYTLTWNLRDSKGKLMPRGDYVIQARIGSKLVKQKRVVIY